MKIKFLPYFTIIVLSFLLLMSGVGLQTRAFHSLGLASNSPISSSEKSETIYVSLSHEGKVERMSVVNYFNKGSEEIIDYGAFTEIVNLSNKAEPWVQDDLVRFLLNEEDSKKPFFYEGVLGDIPLPWTIRMTYLLNGEPLSAEELAGRSGDLTMSIHIRQNSDADQWFGERYLLQLQVPLWLDKVSNVYAPQASKMIAGSSNYVSFIFLPQESQSFVLQAKVKDFEMEAIEIVALQMNPESISMNGFGLSDVDQLLDGLKQMMQATSSIYEGADQMEGGLEEFERQLISIAIHADMLVEGLNEFESQMALLTENVPEFREGSKQINEGLIELYQGSKMLYEGYEEISEGVEKMLEPKDELREIAVKYLLSPSEDIQTMAFAIAGMLNGLEKLDEGIREINGHFGSFSEGLGELSDGYGKMDEGIAELAENVPIMLGEVEPLFDGIKGLMGGLTPMSKGFSDLVQGYKQLPEGLEAMHDGQKMLMSELSVAETWLERMGSAEETRRVISFVSPEKNQVDSVQFIMRTQGITRKVVEEPRSEDESRRNFWQRLLDLFSW